MTAPLTMPVPVPLEQRPTWRARMEYLGYQIRRSPLTIAGLTITLIVLICMAFAPWLASHDPNALNLAQRLAEPSAEHWFGTDEVGRDLFSRVLYGSRQSVGVGLFVAFSSCLVGGLLGCLSGIIGGRFDSLIMRLMDIMLSVPSLVLIMALAAALGPSLFNAMLAITVVRIPFYVRPGPGPGPEYSADGLRQGVPDLRRRALAHRVVARGPQCDAAVAGATEPGHRQRDPDGLGPGFHRPGCTTAHRRMGRDGCHRAQFHSRQLVVLDLSGAGDPGHRDRLQPAG